MPDECTTTGQHVSCAAGSLAVGGTATFKSTPPVAATLESGAIVTNDAP